MSTYFLPVDDGQKLRLKAQGIVYLTFNLNKEERGVVFVSEQELQKALGILGLQEDVGQRTKTQYDIIFRIATKVKSDECHSEDNQCLMTGNN